MKIHLLPPELTHKIAAGEVIERPASILKELLENSLDAGATVLQIELGKGGCASLRITDNGAGMAPADVPLAFQRHATSKLTEFDDLYRLRTFGFRGEALPSIAAVARVELTTREPEALSGTMIVVENGRTEELREAGCPAGTAISVSRIFENVPVRRKFLKSEAAEQGACLEAVTRLALAHPGVKIRVLNNGHPLWDLPATSEGGERIAMVLGKEVGTGLLKVTGVREELSLSGWISRPEITRANGQGIYCFVNGRSIRDALVNHAVMTACRNLIPSRRYPVAVLFLTVPAGDVDVNVHPAKLEVRFRNPRAIYGLVVESLLAALAVVAPVTAGLPATPDAPAYQTRMEEALKRYTLFGGTKKISYRPGGATPPLSDLLFGPPGGVRPGQERESGIYPPTAAGSGGAQPLPVASPHHEATTENRVGTGEASTARKHEISVPRPGAPGTDRHSPPAVPSPEAMSFAGMTFLGQTGGTYLVFSHESSLFLVDQHAAHERILYEELRRGAGEGSMAVQPLLLPEVVALSPGHYGLLMEHRDLLREAGLEVEPFGGHTVAIRSLPALLGQLNPRQLLEDFLEQLTEEGTAGSWPERRERVLISLACRGAVKAGQLLTEEEVARLCRDLDRLPFAGTCPHGRPVWIVLTAKQLAGMFKRT